MPPCIDRVDNFPIYSLEDYRRRNMFEVMEDVVFLLPYSVNCGFSNNFSKNKMRSDGADPRPRHDIPPSPGKPTEKALIWP